MRRKALMKANVRTTKLMVRGVPRIPIYVGTEPLEVWRSKKPKSIYGALSLLHQEDLVRLTPHFGIGPEKASLIADLGLVGLMLETNTIEAGPKGSTLVWVDPEGLVKVPVWA